MVHFELEFTGFSFIVFAVSFIVSLPFAFVVDYFFIWVVEGVFDPLRFGLWLFVACLVSLVAYYWDKVKQFSISGYFKNKKEIREREKELENELLIKQQQRAEKIKLELAFKEAERDAADSREYIRVARDIAFNSDHAKFYAGHMAANVENLIYHGLQSKDYQFATEIFTHYVNDIVPYCGICDITHEVAGKALAIALLSDNPCVSDMIFSELLGGNFDITEVKNRLLLFNLSCYYAIYKDKENMLRAIKQGFLYGNKSSQYMADEDFKGYWRDVDFLNILQQEKALTSKLS